MYEFLAPWGVLIPLISAAVCYYLSASARQKELLKDFLDSTEIGENSSRTEVSHLSVMHG